MKKDLSVCDLLELYGSLLTMRQKEALTLYYEDDLSLAEIAENRGISRQGVMELVRNGREQLSRYEETLGLLKKKARLISQIEQAEAEAERGDMSAVKRSLLIIKESMHGI